MFYRFLIFLIIFSVGAGFGNSILRKTNSDVNLQAEKNTPKAFISEVYDKIKGNYWNNISDAELQDLFKLATEKNGGQVNASSAADIAQTVLASLPPAGRSGLYTEKLEEQLKNNVENIDPQKDLYKDLGLAKGASEAAVEAAFTKLAQGLDREKLKNLGYAKDVLTQTGSKERYDAKGVEPTIFTTVYKPGTLYFQFKKFSPTSYDEFTQAFDNYKNNTGLNSLIFDLRGNIGGAIDTTPYFLGHFIGKNQYAFDFYRKGEYQPVKTPTDKLPAISQYKQIVVLVDQNTQSSAEMMAGSIKKYHAGVVVGTQTKGWGTVERVFQLDNQIDASQKYSMFLVHTITLRDDNQPIEGRGVEPDVNIKNADWEEQLFSYFRNRELIDAVKEVL